MLRVIGTDVIALIRRLLLALFDLLLKSEIHVGLLVDGALSISVLHTKVRSSLQVLKYECIHDLGAVLTRRLALLTFRILRARTA